MQGQLICSGCGNFLLIPGGAESLSCVLCHAITTVPPPGMEMVQLICRGCCTLLIYRRDATSLTCSCCRTVNFAPGSNQLTHMSCGSCHTVLVYPSGSQAVKCAVCHNITNISARSSPPNQTVVVENPNSIDERGQVVSNVVVGVTTENK